MRVIYRKIRNAPYLYIKRNVEKVWGARYTLGARYLSKNTVYYIILYYIILYYIIILYNTYHCVTITYSIQYSNMLYRFVA